MKAGKLILGILGAATVGLGAYALYKKFGPKPNTSSLPPDHTTPGKDTHVIVDSKKPIAGTPPGIGFVDPAILAAQQAAATAEEAKKFHSGDWLYANTAKGDNNVGIYNFPGGGLIGYFHKDWYLGNAFGKFIEYAGTSGYVKVAFDKLQQGGNFLSYNIRDGRVMDMDAPQPFKGTGFIHSRDLKKEQY